MSSKTTASDRRLTWDADWLGKLAQSQQTALEAHPLSDQYSTVRFYQTFMTVANSHEVADGMQQQALSSNCLQGSFYGPLLANLRRYYTVIMFWNRNGGRVPVRECFEASRCASFMTMVCIKCCISTCILDSLTQCPPYIVQASCQISRECRMPER